MKQAHEYQKNQNRLELKCMKIDRLSTSFRNSFLRFLASISNGKYFHDDEVNEILSQNSVEFQ